jgi:HPt (histidine-containing phosphotransfer) domain-containing protein
MDEPILNLESALDRLGGDKEFLMELLNELVIQIDSGFSDLENAVAQSDLDRIKRTAHGFKGASANLNADRLAKLFSELELLGENPDRTAGHSLLDKIRENVKELKELLLNL